MTRKDYKAFAEHLGMERRFISSPTRKEGFDLAVKVMCGVFQSDNGRFDRVRFLREYDKCSKTGLDGH